MPTVTANPGDTLCGIAIRHGLPDCRRLRALESNAAYTRRPLQSGDAVEVPPIEARIEADRDVEQQHEFIRQRGPVPSIRFVHGDRSTPAGQDLSLSFLNISNFRADKGGLNGTSAFPAGFGFNAAGHADPDSFKIEVIDPGAGSGEVDVVLEALKPSYGQNGRIDPDTGVWSVFDPGDQDSDKRQVQIRCQALQSPARFRSRYLRLVADTQDFAALSGDPARTDGSAQALLTTDLADGLGGENDRLEILDQKIRARYVLRNCPAPEGQEKCRVACELPFEQENRKRIRLCVHAFYDAVGGNTVSTLTEQQIRCRTMKYFRRVYAQIGMAPKFVPCRSGSSAIEFLDPPPNDMITISQEHGRPVSATGGPFRLQIRLNVRPEDRAAAADAATRAIAGAVDALDGGIFSAECFQNPKGFSAVNHSYDVLIQNKGECPVGISVRYV